jgi:hypothetical protein
MPGGVIDFFPDTDRPAGYIFSALYSLASVSDPVTGTLVDGGTYACSNSTTGDSVDCPKQAPDFLQDAAVGDALGDGLSGSQRSLYDGVALRDAPLPDLIVIAALSSAHATAYTVDCTIPVHPTDFPSCGPFHDTAVTFDATCSLTDPYSEGPFAAGGGGLFYDAGQELERASGLTAPTLPAGTNSFFAAAAIRGADVDMDATVSVSINGDFHTLDGSAGFRVYTYYAIPAPPADDLWVDVV